MNKKIDQNVINDLVSQYDQGLLHHHEIDMIGYDSFDPRLPPIERNGLTSVEITVRFTYDPQKQEIVTLPDGRIVIIAQETLGQTHVFLASDQRTAPLGDKYYANLTLLKVMS